VKPFSRKFVRDVEEFADRLGLIGRYGRVVMIGLLYNRCHHHHHHPLSSLL
jgi:hypothetical protein